MKTYETLKELIEQLESPNYQTKDGLHNLKDNAAFHQLKALAQVNNLCLSDVGGSLPKNHVIEGLKSMSNGYQVLNGQYVISKNVLDVFIEQTESQQQ